MTSEILFFIWFLIGVLVLVSLLACNNLEINIKQTKVWHLLLCTLFLPVTICISIVYILVFSLIGSMYLIQKYTPSVVKILNYKIFQHNKEN